MQTTITQLRRQSGEVLGPVIHDGLTMDITSQGRVVAQITPVPRGMTGREFAEWWQNRPRLEPELAGEVLQAIKELDQAGHETPA